MLRTDHPLLVTFLVGLVLTIALVVVGALAGWSGETLGTAFMGVVVAVVATRALMMEAERQHWR